MDTRVKPAYDTVRMFLWRGANARPILPPLRLAAILRQRPGSAMAKKTRKRAAAKAAKKSKALIRKKRAKKKTAVAKKRRKAAAWKKSKPVAKKTPVRKKIRQPPPESFPHKVEDVATEIVDILTDAERLHRKLDPGVSREPE